MSKRKTQNSGYKGMRLDAGYRPDLVVEDQVIVEIKAVSELLPVHEAQLLSYRKQVGGGQRVIDNKTYLFFYT